MLLQRGKESQYVKPVHYASRVKTLHERDYSKIELVMTSMVYACRRFRHYLLQKSFTFLTSYSFLPQLFNNSNISKTVMEWVIELQEFQFTCLGEESTRATLTNLLTYKETPVLVKEEVVQKKKVETFALSNASMLYFDGSYRRRHNAASGEIVVYDAEGNLVRKQGLKLDAKSNNEAEYMALEGGLHIFLQMGIKRLQIKGDTLLVVKQVLGVWKNKNPKMNNLCLRVKALLKKFEAWSLQHIERSQNEEAHEAAQGMITCVFVVKANAPLYHGREMLSRDFLLTARAAKETAKKLPKQMTMEEAKRARLEKAKAIQEEKRILEAEQKSQEEIVAQSAQTAKEKEVVDLKGTIELMKKAQKEKHLEEQRAAQLAHEKIKEALKRKAKEHQKERAAPRSRGQKMRKF
ncbi:hypothetical protein L7F22_025311 [Adiantum nelumboides]|nr:hypothetical protein [Adiantum nelumboides]